MEPDFRYVDTNGVRLRLAVAGEGPLVLFVHGFPESWYSWRHQLKAFAEAGFMAAAIDVRGYGGSDQPQDIEAYTMDIMAADLKGVAQALQPGGPCVIIGHDWGAPMAWNSALIHPDQFYAVAGLSIPHAPQGARTVLDLTKETFIDKGKFFYLHYFQEPGIAEAEYEGDVEKAIKTTYYGWSGDAPDKYWHNNKPADAKMFEGIDAVPSILPDWFSEADANYYISEFERVGFRGALNRYRNFEVDHAFLKSLPSQIIEQPALFIGGTRDPALVMYPPNLMDAIKPGYKDLRGGHMLEGIGHWTQQEAPDAVNRLLLDWLAGIDRP